MEPKSGQAAVQDLGDFLEKCYDRKLTLQDLKAFEIKLSLSVLQCLDAIEGSGKEVIEFANRY